MEGIGWFDFECLAVVITRVRRIAQDSLDVIDVVREARGIVMNAVILMVAVMVAAVLLIRNVRVLKVVWMLRVSWP